MSAVLLLTCLPAVVGATEVPLPDTVWAPLQMEAGVWDADITFYDGDRATGKAVGVQTNTLLANGHWIVNAFQVPSNGKFPAYEGHGVWGYDPVAKTYVDTWVDTNDLTVRTDYGYWDAAKSTMTWSSKQSDNKGHYVDYRMTEQFLGDKRIFTVSNLGMVTPTPHLLLKIEFTKRTP